jgi:UV DNA damage endonuclease
MPPKRKRSSMAAAIALLEDGIPSTLHETVIPPLSQPTKPPAPTGQASCRGKVDTSPDHNSDIVDGKTALRASPDADEKGESIEIWKVTGNLDTPAKTNGMNENANGIDSDSPLSEIDISVPARSKKQRKTPTKSSIAAKKGAQEIKTFKAEQAAKKAAAESKIKKEEEDDEWDKRLDPDGDDTGPAEDVDVMKKEAGRPPPINSDYLPLPWKGRLGYVSVLPLVKSITDDRSTGMSQYLSPLVQPPNLHLPNVSHRVYSRT